MKKLKEFDMSLLFFVERLAHGFQRLTGKDNFWLGWFCFIASVGCEYFKDFISAEKPSALNSFLSVTTSYTNLGSAFAYYYAIRNFVKPSIHKGFENPLKHLPNVNYIRLIIITLTLVIFGTNYFFPYKNVNCTILSIVGALLAPSYVYLFCCTPLPPGPNWFERFFSRSVSHA